MRPILQPGNSVEAIWRARLDEHLGQYKIEPVTLRAADLMASRSAIFAVQTLTGHLRLLPERDPHENLFEAFGVILEHLAEPEIAAELLVRFELALLEDLGFGLDLSKCVSTGSRHNLIYVSPKSGRAVCADAGAPYADKMLALPRCLTRRPGNGDQNAHFTGMDDLLDGFALCHYFLHRNVYAPRGISPPQDRERFIETLKKSHAG